MGLISTTRAPLVHVTRISTLGDRVMLTQRFAAQSIPPLDRDTAQDHGHVTPYGFSDRHSRRLIEPHLL